jgi:integrase
VAFLRSVRGDRLYAAFLLSMLGLRRGEVCGLRWSDLDLTGELAEARKLSKGTPSVAVVNNRVSTLDSDGHTLVIEHRPKGKGRARAPYLPAPQALVDALRALKTRRAKERLAAGEAYGSCPTCAALTSWWTSWARRTAPSGTRTGLSSWARPSG